MNNFLIIWFYRVFVALVLGIGVPLCFWLEWKYERQVAVTGCTVRVSTKRNTVIFVAPWVLPFMMAVYWLIMTLFVGPALSTASLLELSLQLLVLLSLYFALLLLLLPLLRRTISARACATLWLLPVFLCYNLAVWQRTFVPPLVVLSIPNGLGPVLLGIWLAGAVAVILWYLISHLRFRRQLLKDAQPINDADVVNLWWDEQRQALVQPHIRLLTSLRRRLKGVMVPRERSSGVLALGLMMATLVLCSGLIWVTTVSGTAGELLFPNQEDVTFQSVWVTMDCGSVHSEEPSPAVSQALLDQLASLPVTRLSTGSILPGNDPPRLSSFLHDVAHMQMLELTDGLCSLTTLGDNNQVSILYQVDGPVDWEGLYALIEEG